MRSIRSGDQPQGPAQDPAHTTASGLPLADQSVPPFEIELKKALEEPSGAASTQTAGGAAPSVSAAEAGKIDKAARDMEAMLLYTLLKQMWSTIPKNPYFDSGLSSQFFQEMYLDELSKRISSTGDGIGVAQIIRRELLDQARRTLTPDQLQSLDELGAGLRTQAAIDLPQSGSHLDDLLPDASGSGSGTAF